MLPQAVRGIDSPTQLYMLLKKNPQVFIFITIYYVFHHTKLLGETSHLYSGVRVWLARFSTTYSAVCWQGLVFYRPVRYQRNNKPQ